MTKKQVEFRVGKEILRGTMFVPSGKGPFPSVIFFHGSGGNGETHFELAKTVAEHGILGFAFNYRGCGLSDGKFKDQTIGMGVEDGETALNFFLSQKKVDRKRLGFLGASFGGFVASLFVNRFNPKSLALVAPASYSPEIYATHRDSDSRLRESFENSESYKEIAKFGGNLLVVSCEFEDVLPPQMINRYLKGAKQTMKKESYILKDSKHKISTNPKARKVLIKKVLEWFLETL